MTSRRGIAAVAIWALPLALVACGGDDSTGDVTTSTASAPTDRADANADTDTDEPADTDSSTGRSALISTSAGEFTFVPETCIVFDDEVEVTGPGTTPDGTAAYVELSAGEGYGSLQIEIGTDEPFTSGSERLATVELTDDLTYTVAGGEITGRASLSDGSGSTDRTEADVEIDCG